MDLRISGKMKYKLTLTDEQYCHIARCVEVVHRISCGQTNELNDILPLPISRNIIEEIKRQAFPELAYNAEYGWDGGYNNLDQSKEFRERYDKFQAQGYQIYRQMWYKRNLAKGIDNVLSSPTLTTDKAQQPIIEIVNE